MILFGYLIRYYYFSVKFVLQIVEQKIEKNEKKLKQFFFNLRPPESGPDKIDPATERSRKYDVPRIRRRPRPEEPKRVRTFN